MFNPRLLLAALLFASACLPVSPSASAAAEEQKSTAAAQRKKSTKVSPSPSPKASPSAAKKQEDAAPAKKKSKKKSKPKPATKKHSARPSSQQESPRRTEADSEKKSEPEKKTESANRPEPEKKSKPEEKAEPEPVRKPTPEPPRHTPKPATRGNSVVIEKSGVVEEEPAPTPEPKEPTHWWWPFGHASHYKYLTQSVRDVIDQAPVARNRWRYIVVHNSGTRQGNAKAFDYYHLHVRKMPNGLAYHFVIGNGTSSGNGKVEIGSRWTRQINGGHVHSDYLNNIALGICLVGDYNRDRPTPEQLEALDELIHYLRHRVGKIDHQPAIVKPHRDINPPQWPTDCPGDRFPYEWLHSNFD